MSEDIYAKPDLTKKVRFKAGEKEDRNTDDCDDIDSVRIYDNCWAQDSTPGDKAEDKSGDNTTENQQQMSSVSVSSGKRNGLRAAAVFLGLLCLLLLVAVIVLMVLFIPERNQLSADNVDLTRERDKLQTNNSEMEIRIHNLTQKMIQLEIQKDQLNATVNDLNRTIEELQEKIETTCCPDWTKFGKSCYWMSNDEKNWQNSKSYCENHEAHLVIISSQEEQKFISSFNRRVWIGLTDMERENQWKWVDGTTPTRTYWMNDQPDNYYNEDCVENWNNYETRNWNDLRCSEELNFICEKMLK